MRENGLLDVVDTVLVHICDLSRSRGSTDDRHHRQPVGDANRDRWTAGIRRDAGKKIEERKRHDLTDGLGNVPEAWCKAPMVKIATRSPA